MQYDYERFLMIFRSHADALNDDLRIANPIQSYGRATAIVHLLRQEADMLERSVVDTLRIGVVNQAKQRAEKAPTPKRRG